MSDPQKFYVKMCGNARLTFTDEADLVDVLVRQDGNFVQISGADFMEMIQVAVDMAKERINLKGKQLEEVRLAAKAAFEALPEPKNPHRALAQTDLSKRCEKCGAAVTWVAEVVYAQTGYTTGLPFEKQECTVTDAEKPQQTTLPSEVFEPTKLITNI